ncbi:MAG: efflux RND transporter permease subunit [bacterium]|nr:efflux RND transporter permease subunit [bacterium]
MQHLIAFALKNRGLVLLLAGLLVAVALRQLTVMPVDVFPELNAPTVVVLTESPGLAADEVEQNVTFLLETAVAGIPGVRRIRSASSIGLSLLWIEFDWGQDIYRARTLVGERLDTVRERLPENAHAEITPITSITGEIMLFALSSPTARVSPMELRSYGEFELRNELLAVPGVAQVVAIGGELPEYQVLVRQDRLRQYDLTITDVVAAARAAHSTAGAGYLTNVDGIELPVRQTSRVRSLADIEGTVIRDIEGAQVTIGHVADVAMGATPQRGAAADRGRPAVVVAVQKSPGTNTLALMQAVDRKLDEIEGTLPAGITINRQVMRQADFINLSVDNVTTVLRDAAIIVAIILILFLLDLRTTLITLLAIPLSLAAALLVLDRIGLSINVMTLGGLAVAIGELVDDAIIDVENVLRRLRENAARPTEERQGIAQVVLAASNEIRSPMVFATVVIAMVFVPLLFLEGLEGRFFRPLGIAYIVATLASLLVALTVTPVLCSLLLRNVKGRGHGDGFVVRHISRLYRPMLGWSIANPRRLMIGGTIAVLASLGVVRTYGTSFLPEFNEGTLTVFLMAPPGTSLVATNRMATGVEQRLAKIEGVRSVVRRTGRAERDEHAEPVSNSEIEVVIEPNYPKAKVRSAIDEILDGVPGITTEIGQPIEHRLSHVLSGTPAAIAIDIRGDDLGTLRRLAQEVAGIARSVPGTRDVNAQREVLITSMPLRYRPADLRAAGLTPATAAEQVEAALQGSTVASVNHGVKRLGLTVRLHPDERATVEQVRNLVLTSASGRRVRLRDVADVVLERSSNLIVRENSRRKATVSCNVAEGYNLGQVVAELRERVVPAVHASGYTVDFGGQFEAQQSATRTILWLGGIVVLVMLLLLTQALDSIGAALLVMVNLPLSLIGGIAAIYLFESPSVFDNTLALFGLGSGRYQEPVVSIASMVGFITLFGIAARNGILLVRHYLDLLATGVPFDQAVVRGAQERLVPILMTALTAALGLAPLAFAAGEPGSEILAPLSIVVLGGLFSSTLLNLLVVPAGFALFFRNRYQP